MHFDLVIFGAGPAGSACAIRARQADLKVLLLDRQRFPRYRPGESLHPGVEPILSQLGIDLSCTDLPMRRFGGVWQRSTQTDEVFSPFNEGDDSWLGYQVPRVALDLALLDKARRAGAETHTDVRAAIDSRWPNWQIRVDGQVHSADVLVNATGSHALASRQLDLSVRKHSPPLFLRFGYVQGRIDEHREAVFEVLEDGWLYQAQIDSNTRHWCRLSSTPLPIHYRPDNLIGLPGKGIDRSQDGTWRSCEPFAGDDYFLVGDAAYRLDPSSSHGVLKALMSGIYVGNLLEHRNNQRIRSVTAANLYQRFLSDLLQHDLDALANTEWFRCLCSKNLARLTAETGANR